MTRLASVIPKEWIATEPALRTCDACGSKKRRWLYHVRGKRRGVIRYRISIELDDSNTTHAQDRATEAALRGMLLQLHGTLSSDYPNTIRLVEAHPDLGEHDVELLALASTRRELPFGDD